MDEDLYDEFGNYVGPERNVESGSEFSINDSDSENEGEDEDNSRGERGKMHTRMVEYDPSALQPSVPVQQQIILHENKQYFPLAEEIYPDAKTPYFYEDAQGIEEPILKPKIMKSFVVSESTVPDLRYSVDFLYEMTKIPGLIRNLAIIGHLHHGKTVFMDTIIQSTHVHPLEFVEASPLTSSASGPAKKSQSSTLSQPNKERHNVRYLDTRYDEQEREMSIKCSPITMLLSGLASPSSISTQDNGSPVKGKTYLFNAIDCPGHVNFSDEACAGMRLVDGVVVVVDAVEGVMMNTERLITHALLEEDLPIVLVISKMDRLVLELKLPPTDAYFKLIHTIEHVNSIIQSATRSRKARGRLVGETGDDGCLKLSPELGNVCFSSGEHGWSFTLKSFSKMYIEQLARMKGVKSRVGQRKRHEVAEGDNCLPSSFVSSNVPSDSFMNDYESFASFLWGDVYLDPASGTFVSSPPSAGAQRSFVSFILEPLYKLYSTLVGEAPGNVARVLHSLGVKCRKTEVDGLDVRPLMKLMLSRFFGPPQGFVQMVADFIPSPVDAAPYKVEYLWGKNVSDDDLSDELDATVCGMCSCDSGLNDEDSTAMSEAKGDKSALDVPLMINVTKMLISSDGKQFYSLGRIYSGHVRKGDRVRVLGDEFTADDDEDMSVETVTGVSIAGGRYLLDLDENHPIGAGNFILLSGVDGIIKKSATITSFSSSSESQLLGVFVPLTFNTISPIRLSIAPLKPSELPKMVEAIRKVAKSYPLCSNHVEESGEHVIEGTGEIYLDCIMHDLRRLGSEVEVKVADPVCCFRETVMEASAFHCFADSANKKNRIIMTAEPLDAGLATDIESECVDLLHWDRKRSGAFFSSRYGWDMLASRSVWSFGPSSRNGPNILLDDTLPSEVDKNLLASVKSSIIQGFQWACREGALCDEPIRNVKFKIIGAKLADEAIHRGPGQIIPACRRAVYSALLMASPRLMEPVYRVEIQCPSGVVEAVYDVLARRRGHVIQDSPKPGAPFYILSAFIPVIDSFGFETDLRSYTQGQAFCSQAFDHWSPVPGDPLDKSIVLYPLEPSPPPHLARDFMVKTRRRKGLTEDVAFTKFFDQEMQDEIARLEGLK